MGKQLATAKSAADVQAAACPQIDFAAEWPGVSAKLLRGLCSRQVSRPDAEDIVQEVAARALTRAAGFATAAHLARWGWRVAWRLRIDAIRRDHRLDHREDLDLPASDDTARVVEGRLAVASVLSGFTSLSPADRVALFDTTAPDATRRDAVRLAVRRHRARARLMRLAGGAAGLGEWVLALVRRLRPHTKVVLAVTAPALILVALRLGPILPGSGVGPSHALRPPQRTSVRADADGGARQDGAARLVGPSTGPTHALVGRHAETIVVVPVSDSSGVRVSKDRREDPPTACLNNVGSIRQLCVDRPGPGLNVLLPTGTG